MKWREKVFIGLFLLLNGFTAHAQLLNDFRCALKESYINGNMDDWPQRIQKLEAQSDGSFEWQFEILKARYGLIGYYLGKGERNLARELLDKSQNYLDTLMILHPNSANLYGVQTGFYGFHIALSILRAPAMLPKMKRSLRKAFELNAIEPHAWLEKGNLAYNKPAAFGGDKKEAIKSYQKTLALLQQERNSSCDWMIIMLQVFLVKAYYQTNQVEAYQIAKLQLEKEYGKMNWIGEFLNATIVN